MDAVLEIKNLTKYFGKKKIIDDISFDVYAGEVFGFLGPNGAGKTTTIKMIMGFLKPDRGSISINHIDVKKDYEKAMENLGGIVENPEMYNELSGIDNLKLYARLHKGVSRERIDEVISMVGMANRAEDKVKKYSMGMKQRMGLAQAMVHRPKVLILDEPTNGLDPAGIKTLRDILKHLAHEENIAVMVSSHLLSEMELMCDRVGIVDKGNLLGVYDTDDLLYQLSGEHTMYHIETPQTEIATGLLKANYADKIKNVFDDHVELAINHEQVPEVITLLAGNGVPIYGVSKAEISLEEAFIKITGGGNTIA